MNYVTDQHTNGNIRFAERLLRQNANNMKLFQEIEQRNRRQTRAPTWGRNKNSTTMYYQCVKLLPDKDLVGQFLK